MPFKSKAQERWGNSEAGKKALGVEGVKEWDEATKGKKLPAKVGAAPIKVWGMDVKRPAMKGIKHAD